MELGPDEIDAAFVAQLRSDVEYVEIAHEAVVYEVVTGTLHQLDATAATVCAFFDGHRSLGMIVDALATEFDADRVTIERDVLELTKVLGHKGLLVGVAADPDSLEGKDEHR